MRIYYNVSTLCYYLFSVATLILDEWKEATYDLQRGIFKKILKARYIYIFRTKIYLMRFLYPIGTFSNRDLILWNDVCPNSRISLPFPVSMDKIKQSGNTEPLISMNLFDSFEEALASSECAGSRLYSDGYSLSMAIAKLSYNRNRNDGGSKSKARDT